MKQYLLLLLLLPTLAQAQTVTVRVVTYNLLNFPGTTLGERAVPITTVIAGVNPDILVVEDLENFAASVTLQLLLAQLTSSGLVAADQFDGPGTDNGMLYDSTKLELVGHDTIGTEPRYTDIWTVVVNGTTDTIIVYGTHLKAGETQQDWDVRDSAAEKIRRHAKTLWPKPSLIAGDLNVYKSSEATFGSLTRSDDGTDFLDPIQRRGTWQSDGSFADIHTHSTRLREFGGGIGGGLNNRFDFVLLSASLLTHYVAGSYTTFGNDGLHIFDSINAMPNTAVDSVMAQALHDASDHLPVYLDLEFQKVASGVEEDRRRMEMDLVERK